MAFRNCVDSADQLYCVLYCNGAHPSYKGYISNIVIYSVMLRILLGHIYVNI